MEIKRVLAFYFSATSTTEKVAGTLAETAGGASVRPGRGDQLCLSRRSTGAGGL